MERRLGFLIYVHNELYFVQDGIILVHMDGSSPVRRSRRGRPPIGDRSLTSTDRSKRRFERLVAREVSESEMREGLAKLHDELVAAGVPDRAREVAHILQSTALKAVAEYTRRMSMYFVQNGPASFNQEEKSTHEQQIIDLANRIESLVLVENLSYEQFEEILRQLHARGFFPENSLVMDVAHAFCAGR
jgi:hypothetical protein